jgi:methenyltetrahydromethanopterin cyclohydrolase
MADLGQVQLDSIREVPQSFPAIRVRTEKPLAACMASQYAGWQLAVEDYRAMCSGPIRAAYGKEKLFSLYPFPEKPSVVVGVLEADKLPSAELFRWIRGRLPMDPAQIVLCVAKTNSIAGRIQIVARSVETTCHKLFEMGFDLKRIQFGEGVAPLPPASPKDWQAMGSTNDAILLASRVRLVVDADERELAQLGPRIPSASSAQFGRPFLDLLTECEGDFYRLDPMLFAPAEISLQSSRGGSPQMFGKPRFDLYANALDRLFRSD